MRRIDYFGAQCLRGGREELNPPYFLGYNNRGIQQNLASMSFDDGMWRLNAKLDSLMHFVEQYMNVNVLNSSYMICVLCGG